MAQHPCLASSSCSSTPVNRRGPRLQLKVRQPTDHTRRYLNGISESRLCTDCESFYSQRIRRSIQAVAAFADDPLQPEEKNQTMPGSGSSSSTSPSSSSSSSSSSPCAACKLLRRKCTKECIFAPYFPPDEPQKFAFVHKVFGASNVSKMLQDLPVHQRRDAVSSIVYEANARVCDPVYGCVGAISTLQQQVVALHRQLAVLQAEMVCLKMQQQQQQQQQTQLPAAPKLSPDAAALLPSSSSSTNRGPMNTNVGNGELVVHKFSAFSSPGLETLDAIESQWTCH